MRQGTMVAVARAAAAALAWPVARPSMSRVRWFFSSCFKVCAIAEVREIKKEQGMVELVIRVTRAIDEEKEGHLDALEQSGAP